MTKKYIVTKDQIQSTVTTSEFPPSSTAVQTELAKKVNIAQGVAEAGKYLKVGTDGNLAPAAIDAQVKANWTETDTESAAYIQNKPFVSIGSGLTVTNNVLTANEQLHFKVFETLPTASSEYAQVIALVLKTETETGNIYKEYACVNTGTTATPSWKWEQIGESKFELTITQDASGITINNTALQSATAAQKGLLTKEDWATFNGKQDALTFDDTPTASSANPVTSGGIKTELDKKVDKVTGSSLVPDTKVSQYDAHIINGDIHVTAEQKTAWTAKQEAIPAGTAGNVVTYSGTAGTVGSLGFDDAPTASSANLVKSGAISTALAGKVTQDDASSVSFKIGCDATGPYIDY